MKVYKDMIEYKKLLKLLHNCRRIKAVEQITCQSIMYERIHIKMSYKSYANINPDLSENDLRIEVLS